MRFLGYLLKKRRFYVEVWISPLEVTVTIWAGVVLIGQRVVLLNVFFPRFIFWIRIQTSRSTQDFFNE